MQDAKSQNQEHDESSLQESEMKLSELTQCCLCGGDLKFEHHVDFSFLLVREDAHCPSCRIPLRSKEYRLQ